MATWKFMLVKMMDMGYIATIYAILSALALFTVYTVFGKYEKKEDKAKSSLQLALEAIGLLWGTGIFFYLVRNVVGDHLPSPFHGLAGYDHYKLKEFANAGVFMFLFMQFFAPLKEKIKILYDRHLD
jgi:membrane protease YdiL (CAAX protease family)